MVILLLIISSLKFRKFVLCFAFLTPFGLLLTTKMVTEENVPTAYAQLAIPLTRLNSSQSTNTPERQSLLSENEHPNGSSQQQGHHHNYDPNEWITEDIEARDRLIRSLRYNFMSPKDRSMITHRFPGKLVLQIFKILVVSYQLYHFGSDVEQYKAADSSMVSFFLFYTFLF